MLLGTARGGICSMKIWKHPLGQAGPRRRKRDKARTDRIGAEWRACGVLLEKSLAKSSSFATNALRRESRGLAGGRRGIEPAVAVTTPDSKRWLKPPATCSPHERWRSLLARQGTRRRQRLPPAAGLWLG